MELPEQKEIGSHTFPVCERWFVLHILQNSEEIVRENLRGVPGITNFRIPLELVSELKGDRKVTENRYSFPGYAFVKMTLSQALFLDILAVPGVAGFIGISFPEPVPEKFAEDFLEGEDSEFLKPSVIYESGNQIVVTTGVFKGHVGLIESIDENKRTVKVSVSVFGRNTLVEFEDWMVETV